MLVKQEIIKQKALIQSKSPANAMLSESIKFNIEMVHFHRILSLSLDLHKYFENILHFWYRGFNNSIEYTLAFENWKLIKIGRSTKLFEVTITHWVLFRSINLRCAACGGWAAIFPTKMIEIGVELCWTSYKLP